jgi:hypothetical protein
VALLRSSGEAAEAPLASCRIMPGLGSFTRSPSFTRRFRPAHSLRRVRHALPSSSDHRAACSTSDGTLVTYWGNVRFRERRRGCERRAWRTRPSSRGCMRHARRGFRRRQRPASHRKPARLQSATFGSRTASPLRGADGAGQDLTGKGKRGQWTDKARQQPSQEASNRCTCAEESRRKC